MERLEIVSLCVTLRVRVNRKKNIPDTDPHYRWSCNLHSPGGSQAVDFLPTLSFECLRVLLGESSFLITGAGVKRREL
jgi:hypothetical protein